MLLSVALTTVIFSGCSFFDSVIGGVASIHTTRIVLNVPSVVLWQYYDKRKQTRQYKEADMALVNQLTNHFVDRLKIKRQRELRYPWQSD